jgi:Cu-Zn family superoxide dismutase
MLRMFTILALLLFYANMAATSKVIRAQAFLYNAVEHPDTDGLSSSVGSIEFVQQSNGTVTITGTITSPKIPTGPHGFHVHQFGLYGNSCNDAGPHFNPHKKEHGSPDSSERHVGDLGNVIANEQNITAVMIRDSHVSLNGENSIIGRAVVVHEKPDDLGKGTGDSKKTGNAGKRLACGIIGLVKEEESQESAAIRQTPLLVMVTILFTYVFSYKLLY